MSEDSTKPVAAKAANPPKKVRFKDPKCTGFNVQHIGTINETHLTNAAVINVLKRDPVWFAKHFIEE